jgi:hypothetical protein
VLFASENTVTRTSNNAYSAKAVNVEQTRHYNHVHCETYIEKIVSRHGWDKLKIRSPPTPMKSDSKYQVDIQTSQGSESLNRTLAMVPLAAPLFGLYYLQGHISLKNWT